MRLQFTLFETLLSIQLILIVSLFFMLELNNQISNSNSGLGELKGASAIYDFYQQTVQNKSFQQCILQNNLPCLTQVIFIYQSAFSLTDFGIKTTNSTFGEFDSKYLLTCFALTPNDISSIVCISSGG